MAGNLTPNQIKSLENDQLVSDGGGLYLQITKTGAKSWIYRYQINRRRRDMGLGGYPEISLGKARKARDEQRKLVRMGIDPLAERDRRAQEEEEQRREQQRLEMTFGRCFEEFYETKRHEWTNPKHQQQWKNTIEQYAYPVLEDELVKDITTEMVRQVLDPIWRSKTETAKRVQGRIEKTMDYAKALGYRTGENPARWRGHLDIALPRPGKIQTVKHQRALPIYEAPALATIIRELDTPASRALHLTLLCATRTGETLEATWDEIDLNEKLWIIPAKRMKANKEHRIPLADEAVAIVRRQEELKRDQWVFPGQKRGKPLSDMAMNNVLKRTGWVEQTTVHGLRSTFRDWVAEKTTYPQRLAEVALAHQLTDKVQAAYFRSDLMEKRREMMGSWAKFLERP